MKDYSSKFLLARVAIKYPKITWKKLVSKIKTSFGIKNKFPDPICILLYQGCNLQCKMCGQWRRKVTQNVDYLPFPILKKCFDEIKSYGSEIYIWGGEPTLHPEFTEVITYLKKQNLLCTINTNGILLEKYAKLLVKISIDSIDVSIDGINGLHDFIRGQKGAFKKIIRGLKLLSEEAVIQERKKPLVKAIVTISNWNKEHLKNIVTYLDKLPHIDMIIIQLGWYIPTNAGKAYDARLKNDFCVTKSAWKGFENNKSSELLRNNFIFDISEIRKSRYRKPVLFFPELNSEDITKYYSDYSFLFEHNGCPALNRELQILSNGDTSICLDWPDVTLGNVKEQNISKIWNGKQLELFRKNLNDKGLFPVCNRCCALFR